MGIAEFFASLPRGKKDKPLLLAMGPLVYDFHDIDGLYYMLDRELGGCMLMLWSKPMDKHTEGYVTINGGELKGCRVKTMAVMNGMDILALPLRGVISAYGREYTLHVEGYCDADGNIMNPQDFTVHASDKTEPDPAYTAHEKIALEAAREGIVLLRNENDVLPLDSGVLNLFGKGIHEFRISAVGAGKINPRYSVNFIEAVRSSDLFTLNEELVSFYSCDKDLIPGEAAIQNAVSLSQTAIVFLTRASGENQDASTAEGEYALTAEENALLKTVSEAFAHTVVILNTGYPVSLSFLKEYRIDGLVYLGYAGMLAGPALLDVLSGAVTPSGKLPDSWAWDYCDIPSSRNFYDNAHNPRLSDEGSEYVDTVYEEDIYVGYRYFTTFGVKPAFPFGFGLSYTSFVIEPDELRWNGRELTMRLFIKNMRKTAGKEVVQIYIGKPDSELEKPLKELVWFEKTRLLQPGEVQEVSARIPREHLSVYSEKLAAYILDAGEYKAYVGNSSDAGLYKSFRISQREILKQVKNRMHPMVNISRLSKTSPVSTYPAGENTGIVPGKCSFQPYTRRLHYEADFHGQLQEKRLNFEDVRDDPGKADDFTAQLSVEELARLAVCASAGWGMEGIGEAGSIFQLDGWNIPRFPVADGNSGVNVNKKNIGMPSGTTLCASFNKQLCEDVGRVIGEEAKEAGISMVLAPALNIHRNPLNGRQPEYFSEDPFLAGVMAGHYLTGLENTGVAGCIKHMICNNCESARKRNQSVVSERAIREVYFRAFQYAMEIHMPASVMTAYNAVNGVPTSADADLMLGLMREENGFDGFFMTDWTSYETVDIPSMIQAGMCWITPGSLDDQYTSQITAAVEKGHVDLSRLRCNIAALLHVLAKFS